MRRWRLPKDGIRFSSPSLRPDDPSSVVGGRSSINRPPTPNDDDEEEEEVGKEASLGDIINLKLVESGEKERLMELLRERLVECGWRDDMKALCRFGSSSVKVRYNVWHVFYNG
ncbi:unnamed protein product [Triticum turgidum subsp. durum]|uniref:Transcription and mRNA export factor ENY2 n=1 Tax=Triticum turgidum subsp. durum TaxID=4567 RepID=A0A9R0VQP1_TRITD|nr:unnamed protein product [Triticum turgidum subsp. durum]